MTTEERLEYLERTLARMKRRDHWLAGALTGVIAVWLVFAGTQRPAPVTAQDSKDDKATKVIRANAFEVIDEKDNVRARLAMDNTGMPALILSDEKGWPRVAMDMVAGNPGLTLRDEEAVPRVMMRLLEDGNPALGLFDENCVLRVRVFSDERDTILRLFDEKGKPRLGLSVLDRLGPSLFMTDANEKPIWSAP